MRCISGRLTVKWKNLVSEPVREGTRCSRVDEIRDSYPQTLANWQCIIGVVILPRNTCVRSILPTGSIWYLEGLSLILRKRSFAVRRGAGPDASESGASAKGSFEPLLRFRPVRLGTVTLSRTLFDWTLVDWTDRAMTSSGRNTRLASVPSLAGSRICSISAYIQYSCRGRSILTVFIPESPCKVLIALSTLRTTAGCSTLTSRRDGTA